VWSFSSIQFFISADFSAMLKRRLTIAINHALVERRGPTMLSADLAMPRPSLTHPGLLARIVERLGQGAGSSADVWRQLTDNYAVDLDAVAALLPCAEPEPLWLTARAQARKR
jgi:hypothetical protein